MPSASVRTTLRAATTAAHERVDGVFSRFDLADRSEYARFLAAQAAAHWPVEAALDASRVGEIVADWPARRRGEALAADLAALDTAMPAGAAMPVPADPAAMLGMLYVIEGSRLGGAMLRRSVPEGFPTAFLSRGDSAMWRSLQAILDDRLVSDDDVTIAIRAACDVFSRFEAAGRQFLKAE